MKRSRSRSYRVAGAIVQQSSEPDPKRRRIHCKHGLCDKNVHYYGFCYTHYLRKGFCSHPKCYHPVLPCHLTCILHMDHRGSIIKCKRCRTFTVCQACSFGELYCKDCKEAQEVPIPLEQTIRKFFNTYRQTHHDITDKYIQPTQREYIIYENEQE